MITAQLLPMFLVGTCIAAGASWTDLVREGSELARAGNLAAARDAFRRAVASEDARSVAPEALSTAWSDIGVLSHELGSWREALSAYTRALEVFEKGFGPDHPRAVGILLNIATVHLDEARFADADRILKRASAILAAPHVAADARLVMRSLIIRGGVLLGRHEHQPAAALLQQALAIASSSPEFASEAAAVLNNLSVTAVGRGDLVSGRAYIERAVTLLESLERANDPQLIRPLQNVAHIAIRQRRYGEAVDSLARAVTIANSHAEMAAAVRAQLLAEYSGALKKAGRKEEARQASARAKAVGLIEGPHTVDIYTLSARPKQ
jgi:tetratricopeptide (TPR) repeat protein